MAILDKVELSTILENYYKENFGQLETDRWYEQPAVNVWMFERDGNVISLKVNLLSGEVQVFTEQKRL